jgi:DNA modification methylase
VKDKASGKDPTKHPEFPITARELTEDEFCKFLIEAFSLVVSHSVEGATFFACLDWRRLSEILSTIRSLGCALLNLCVWVRSDGDIGSLYRSRHELVFVFGRRDATSVNSSQLGKHGRNRTNVWNYPGVRGRRRCLHLRPTVMPISMVSDAILDVTRRGDIVLDPFSGSGTTILAAEHASGKTFDDMRAERRCGDGGA